MRTHLLSAKIAATAFLVAGVVLTCAEPAHAAGDMEVTWPGGSTADPLSAPLFDGISGMVPTDSKSATFVVSNLSDTSAYLRVTLIDLQSTDDAFSTALTISTSTAATIGLAVPVAAADPCRVLLEGDMIAAGDSLAVTTGVELGDLEGLEGQGALLNFSLRVSLSETAGGSLAPSACGSGGTVIQVARATPVPAAPRTGRDRADAPDGAPAVVDAEQTPTGPTAPIAEPMGGLAFTTNTQRLFEEFTLVFLLVPWLLGVGVYLVIARRRRRVRGDHES